MVSTLTELSWLANTKRWLQAARTRMDDQDGERM
jgi:hypothetical protein